MTADSLKTFIALPTATIYKKAGGGGGSSRAKLFCFSLFLVAFCVTVSCYQVWSFLRTNELRTEVDQLRDKLENMRKRMGLEIFDDFDEFQNLYDPQLEGGEEHSENGIFSDDLNDFDEDIEDQQYDEAYDLDSDMVNDDDDDEIDSGSGFLKFLNSDDYDIHQRADSNSNNQRKPRAAPQHEVPIVPESYAVRRNKTTSTTDDRVAEFLLGKKNESPRLFYDWEEKGANRVSGSSPPSSPSRDHQSPPRRQLKKYLEHRGPPTLHVTRQGVAETDRMNADDQRRNGQPQIHIRHNNHHQQQQPNRGKPQRQQQHQLKSHQNRNHHKFQPSDNNFRWGAPLTSPNTAAEMPQPILVRDSRVMATDEDKSKAFRQTITKREYARLKALQSPTQFVESVGQPEMRAYPPTQTHNRSARRSVSSGHRLIAVQYNGNASIYEPGRGHDKINHVGGVYRYWSNAPWVNEWGLNKYFSMDEGVVTAHEMGIYYIYAQINFYDTHDRNGFVIKHNDVPIQQCSVEHTTHGDKKTNICHTGGMAYLRKDDTIQIEALEHNRISDFKAERTFFGLMRVPGVYPQHH